jgi:hypothetical protein
MLKLQYLCPPPRGLVIVYADPPKNPKDIDEDTDFIRVEDAAGIAYIEDGRKSGVVVLAMVSTGRCEPAADTEGFMGTMWEDDKKERERFKLVAMQAYEATIRKGPQ